MIGHVSQLFAEPIDLTKSVHVGLIALFVLDRKSVGTFARELLNSVENL